MYLLFHSCFQKVNLEIPETDQEDLRIQKTADGYEIETKKSVTELKLEVPNDTTAAAIEEGRKMMKDPSAPRYSSMDALKAALDV